MKIRPYGDTLDDGAVQLSFTLPVPKSAKAEEAARVYTKQLGFDEVLVTHMDSLSENFTFFIVYGKSKMSVDYDKIVVKELEKPMTFEEVNVFISDKIKRKIIVIGACTGSDAHTVGIDAIMNMKGYNHHNGLERYSMIDALNMGSQVSNEELVAKIKELKADAVLVSKIVTQKDLYKTDIEDFFKLLKKEKIDNKLIKILGGPGISDKTAVELGFDTGFGKGTLPEHVATYIAKKMAGV